MIAGFVPTVQCPSCLVNVVEVGFTNECTETRWVREKNFILTFTSAPHNVPAIERELYFTSQHNDVNDDTVEHECEIVANCANCDQPLPWSTGALREAFGVFKLLDITELRDRIVGLLGGQEYWP